jgi:VanZ family protein
MKKLFAILFLGFILLIIFAADADAIPPFIRDIYRFPGGDLVGHFALYGLLAFLSAWAFPRRLRVGRFAPAVTSLLVAALALAEEISQFFFPLRTPSLLDLACGLLGILLADWLAAR